jgi:hypothetical protein
MPPKKMSMQISNGNFYSSMVQPVSKPAVDVYKPKLSLSSSMIQRIHNVRPGCGSCGK